MQIHTGDVAALEQNVRSRLASSLENLWRQAGDVLPANRAARAALTSSIRAQPQHPRVFARYYDLALALMDSRQGDAQRIGGMARAQQLISPQEFPAVAALGRTSDRALAV